MFLASGPYVDFLRFDGTEYPDWAVQPEYIKQLFMPYVNSSVSKGGIDYNKNMYWIGTTCVYAASMAEMFKMLGHPLMDYTNMVDKYFNGTNKFSSNLALDFVYFYNICSFLLLERN